jgi:pyruvate kinase
MMKNAVLQSPAKKGQPSRAEITDAAMGVPAECVMLMPFLQRSLDRYSHTVRSCDVMQRIATTP